MTLKRALWWAFWLFLLFFVVSSPDQAAQVANSAWCHLKDAASQVTTFLARVF